jgi:hypothetical protein
MENEEWMNETAWNNERLRGLDKMITFKQLSFRRVGAQNNLHGNTVSSSSFLSFVLTAMQLLHGWTMSLLERVGRHTLHSENVNFGLMSMSRCMLSFSFSVFSLVLVIITWCAILSTKYVLVSYIIVWASGGCTLCSANIILAEWTWVVVQLFCQTNQHYSGE